MLRRLAAAERTRARSLFTPDIAAPTPTAHYRADAARLRALLISELSRSFAALAGPLIARSGAGPITLRAHPNDLAELPALPGDAPLTRLADPSLTRGGCVVESAAGMLDATVEARVARLLAAAEVAI